MSQHQYTPYTLNIDDIRLVDNNPSDDYQRLYFNHLLKQQNKNNNNSSSHDLNLSIKRNNYKSNIVNIFNNPPYLSLKDNGTPNTNNNLCCFEYQLPDVDSVVDKSIDIRDNLIDNTPYVLRGSIKIWDNNNNNNGKVIKKNQNITRRSNDNEKLVITKKNVSNENNNYKNIITSGISSIDPTIKTNKSIYDLNTKTGNISLSSNQNLTSLDPSLKQNITTTTTLQNTVATNSDILKNNSDVAQGSLTKNQQFKLTKLNYNSLSNSNLINPNNCILWDKNTGYVFVTGIWRLYQDIMNGLSSMDRVSTTNLKNGADDTGQQQQQQHVYVHSNDLKEKCRLELDHILNYAFYEPISWDGKQTRRRKSSLSGSVDDKKKYFQSSNNNKNSTNVEDKTPEYTHYVDLHWNNLSKDLKQLILDDFQKFLNKNYPENHINNLDLSLHIIQRIRGGYIKIQGTWLPWTVARLMCTRFCFPIRWLLVPLFGPQFPKDCEDYYFNIMLKNMEYIEHNNPLTGSKKDIRNHKKSSTRTRRNTYSGDVSSMTTPTRTRQRKKRHSTTNIPPPPPPSSSTISPKEEEISPRTKKIDLKISNDKVTNFPPQFIPKVSRRRSKSDFGINPYMNFNPLLSSTIVSSSSPPNSTSTSFSTTIPSSLPPIKSVFEQINPYDVPFLTAPNTLFNIKNNNNKSGNYSNQSFMTRPRINSLPCPNITNPSKYYTNNYTYNVGNPSSGVSAVSNLSMFYNTRGHRYPKDYMQPRVVSGNDENIDSTAAAATTTTTNTTTHDANKEDTLRTTKTSNFLSYGVSSSETFYADNNGANYNSNCKWFTGT